MFAGSAFPGTFTNGFAPMGGYSSFDAGFSSFGYPAAGPVVQYAAPPVVSEVYQAPVVQAAPAPVVVAQDPAPTIIPAAVRPRGRHTPYTAPHRVLRGPGNGLYQQFSNRSG
mmetsp:Transcript_107355/g.149683  ORF Transcript_107355/g.149683 Transcript_107355/m.149683 type:complete len:112 (-) Transcript_107355:141-476(-)